MVKVYLNPGKLDERLAAIDKFSESVRTAYRNIQNYYTNDPIEGREDLRFCMDRFVSEGDDLIIHIQKIKDIKTKIEQLNSSGVATIDADGRITLEAPDDSVESPEKFQMWSRGYLDANDLSAGKSPLPSGRSIDEVRESMKFNKDDSTYANTFIDRVGPENLTKLGDENPKNNREASVIGEILSTASQTWDKEKSKKNADLIIGSVDDKEEWKRIPILTQMMANHDANRDGINDLNFGTDFLVSLGNAAEKMPIDEIKEWRQPFQTEKTTRNYPFEVAYDPLYGVIDAMTHNGEAAAMFFGKNGVDADENDINRGRQIAQRHDIGENKWTDNLAAISSAMSNLGKIDTTEASPEKIERSNQAALGTSIILNAIGENGKKFSDAALKHVGVALANYAAGVDNSINKGGGGSGATSLTYLSGKIPDGAGNIIDSYPDDFWKGLPTQPTFSHYALSNLAGQVGLVEHGLDGLNKEMRIINDQRMKAGIQDYRQKTAAGVQANSGDVLKQSLELNRRAQGFITGAIGNEAEQRQLDADLYAKQWINFGMGLTTYIPGLKEAGNFLKSSKTYAQSRMEDGTKSILEESFANNELKAGIEAANREKNVNEMSDRDIMSTLIQSGAISDKEIANWEHRGGSATIINSDGTLNRENLQSKDTKVMEGVRQSYVNLDNYFAELANDPVEYAFNASKEKFTEGVDLAKGPVIDNSGGRRKPPNMFEPPKYNR